MPKPRIPLSAKPDTPDTEIYLKNFVLNGSHDFKNLQGQPAWAESSQTLIELEQIVLPEFQLRLYYDRATVDKIKTTARSFGIREPLLLRPHPTEAEKFELVAGSQRRLAAQELGLASVPCKIDRIDDITALKIALIENDARSNINPYEETRATMRLLELCLGISQPEVVRILRAMFNATVRQSDGAAIPQTTQDAIALVFQERGLDWKSFISNRLPLLKLPEDIKSALEKGLLEYTKAVLLGKVEDKRLRQELLQQVLTENLSGNQIQQLIARSKPPEERNEYRILRARAQSVVKKVTSPKLLKNPETLARVENLLAQLEAIVAPGKN
ncbi:MAG: Nucleoid occlusion protein [Chroococcidiopsis sp. SAG 2025]|uniref:ParB/RepB/Spo0J family partition protein n=1 Tax=Chroococcidiopsis sp. SAG 2025 TaxID=171389 RepID=UPI002936E545|nr:ParB/RepB/Spo0J family partition protein [Chroococcidiopsis sp. SAG 2025]MDV2997349.1 Nucleoid occlusion protein [Chroococcidiopsis sp. SAG 2025]